MPEVPKSMFGHAGARQPRSRLDSGQGGQRPLHPVVPKGCSKRDSPPAPVRGTVWDMTHRIYATIGRRLLLGILTAGFITATSATAQAQAFISPMFGIDFSGDTGCPNIDSCEDKKTNISVSAGILGRLQVHIG